MKLSIPYLNMPRINIIQPKRKSAPGQMPGTFVITDTTFPSKMYIYSYEANVLDEFQTNDIKEAISFIDRFPHRNHWLDIKGLGTQEVLDFIQKKYQINSLVMEDIVNTHQRPKNEEYGHYLFVVSRMIELDKGLSLKNEQLAFLLFNNLLISFQEDDDDILEPVRNRLIKNVNGNIRNLGSSYLIYAIMDTVIDHYFTILNRLADELEMVEDHLY